MERKKYKLTEECKEHFGRKLYRIKALIDFGDVKAGDLGGYIESEKNLSHNDNCWVYGNARVYGNADYTTIKGFGTEYRNTTFFRCKDGAVRVKCGCFYGTIEEFRTQVNNTRDGKIAKEYLMIADLMEYHFAKE